MRIFAWTGGVFLAAVLTSSSANAACDRSPTRKTAGQVLKDCEAYLETATLAAKDRARAAFYRGKALVFLGRLEEGIAAFGNALAVDPALTGAYNWRGVSYAKSRRPDKALIDLTEYIKRRPEASEGYINRGSVYSLLRRPDEALSDFKEAARLSPKQPNAIRGLAGLYHQRGDFKAALAAYDQLIALKPNSAQAYADRGMVQADRGDYAAAKADFDAALQRDTLLYRAYWGRCWAHGVLGNGEAALEDCNRAARRGGQWRTAVALPRAVAHFRLGDVIRAMGEVEQAIGPNGKGEWRAYAVRGVLRDRQGQSDLAAKDFDEAAHRLGDQARLDIFIAALRRQGAN